MKATTFIPTALLLLLGVASPAGAGSQKPATFCRFVPERSDDFAWENDLIAFRAYGPALREGTENSGIDCWLKCVEYPIIDTWYGQMKTKSYHKDWGEGNDPYHVGSSAGCGGTGIWLNGKREPLETYTKQEVVSCRPEKSVFKLTYEKEIGGAVYGEEKTVTIELGQRLFHASCRFTKDGTPAANLPVCIGITTHDGKAVAIGDAAKGWMACWESIESFGVGTGVVVDPSKIQAYRLVESPTKDVSHSLFIGQTDAQGRIEYYAGYGWEKAGAIKTSADWNAYLEGFRQRLINKDEEHGR
ncbi:DUF4861 family protein [Pontiella sp.]|uniref:DUF4861 family protein n=1 Tax=Pontiella sp. TaxID=2837462 RepID=UPI003569B628